MRNTDSCCWFAKIISSSIPSIKTKRGGQGDHHVRHMRNAWNDFQGTPRVSNVDLHVKTYFTYISADQAHWVNFTDNNDLVTQRGEPSFASAESAVLESQRDLC